MFRLILLLLTFGGLAIFVFQNVSPVLPLVILGMQTQAFPLGLWVIGAIALGALTTFIVAALIRLSAPPPRRPRGGRTQAFREPTTTPGNPPTPPSSSSGSDWTPPAWAAGRSQKQKEPVDAARRSQRSTSVSDWEEPRQTDEWDDWVEPATGRSRPPRDAAVSDRRDTSRYSRDSESYPEPPRYEEPLEAPYIPPVYDAEVLNATPPQETATESYAADARRYAAWSETPVDTPRAEPELRTEPETEPETEVWDDWEEAPANPSRPSEEPPESQPRDFVEVRRDPQTRYQSGTIYSYSYRSDENTDNTRRTPPSTPAQTPPSPPVSASDDSKTPRVIIPPTPAAQSPSEPEEPFDNPFSSIPEDEAWEDWDEEPLSPTSKPPEAPYQNPPLNLGERGKREG